MNTFDTTADRDAARFAAWLSEDGLDVLLTIASDGGINRIMLAARLAYAAGRRDGRGEALGEITRAPVRQAALPLWGRQPELWAEWEGSV